jgi:AmiR/NasT family two-component response regulator
MARPVTVPRTTVLMPAPLARSEETEALRRENEALRRALTARRLLERAKIVRMKQHGLSEPNAHRCIPRS